jgi:rhodanese-related sulfurtransferase
MSDPAPTHPDLLGAPAVLAPATPTPGGPAPVVTREQLAARLGDPSLVVLNVLSAEAFAQGHIPGSLNLPVEEIPTRARRLLPDPAQEIIVHCGGFT